jgi:SPP1 gp7 family putative phage head morphogenesis protein
VERYAAFADVEISTAVGRSIELGLQGSLETVQAYFTNPRTQAAIGARWDMLAAESVETMLGYTAADSPLRQALVGRLGETVAARVSDALVQGIALGINPRDVANIMRRELGLGLTWSLTTARTAMISAYRDSARINYMANSDVVSGWKWQAALDDRTCMSCWSQHGSVHAVNEPLQSHHNCRCTMIPIVPLAAQLGIKPPDVPPGEELFKGLSEAEQRRLMGPGMYDAWREGRFSFSDLSVPYEDKIYGTMSRVATLKELVGT